MLQKLKENLSRETVRPIIYTVFSRFLISLCAALLADYLIGEFRISVKTWAYTLFAVVYAVGAWLSYLKLDGMKLPKRVKLPKLRKKHPMRTYSDMSDHVDDEVEAFDELEEDEKSAVRFVSDIILCIAFIILGIIL